MNTSFLEQLNSAQREAAAHTNGPLLVIAGAGTGKTRTLAARVANLLEIGVAADRILLLTFTRRAAAQMIAQVREFVETSDTTSVWHGTFHAVSHRLLRIYNQAVDLPPDFAVIDQGDAADMMQLIRADLGLTKTDKRFPGKITLTKIHSHVVSARSKLKDVLEEHFPWCIDDHDAIARVFKDYHQKKRENHVLDYDDLLMFWRSLCTTSPVAESVAQRFDHVLVDEYQDTNLLQSDIIRGMRSTCDNIMAVGDDAQSIYSFRAANVRNILDFPQQFPGTRMITLEENYRSTQPILAASNAIMEQARERFTKNLYSERESNQKPVLHVCMDEDNQAELICRRVLDHAELGIALRDQAVLFRAANHSARLEIDLTRRKIPFHKFGGLKFVETAHIKDVLAFLRILETPTDQLSWMRIFMLMPGIGAATARKLLHGILTDSGEGVARSPLQRLIEHPPKPPAQAAELFGGLVRLVRNCQTNGNGSKSLELSSQIDLIRGYYHPLCELNYDNWVVRQRDLEQLAALSVSYRSRRRLITDLTLDPPTSTSDFAGAPYLNDDYLVLSTIHSAKGCEWTSVHILNAADGMIPSDMALKNEEGVEEERRLLYVAMTRAKNFLYVYLPLRFYHSGNRRGDRHSLAQLTRYIDSGVDKLFERRSSVPESAFEPRTGRGVSHNWLDDLF